MENRCRRTEAVLTPGAAGSQPGCGRGEGRRGIRGVLADGALSCHWVAYGAAWGQEKRIRGAALGLTTPSLPFHHYPKPGQLPFTGDLHADPYSINWLVSTGLTAAWNEVTPRLAALTRPCPCVRRLHVELEPAGTQRRAEVGTWTEPDGGCAGSASSPAAGSASSPAAQALSSPVAGSASSPVTGSASSPVAGSASSPAAQALSSPAAGSASSPAAQALSSRYLEDKCPPLLPPPSSGRFVEVCIDQ